MSENHWWQEQYETVAKSLDVDIDKGLTEQEASARLKRFGFNQLPEQKAISPLKIFLNQFASFVIWFLLIAAAIAGILGEWIDALAIGAIVIFNAIMGFIQEYRAEQALAALKKMTTPYSKVIREGGVKSVPSEKIVPGDLILVEAGDRIPADGRLVKVVQLTTQEAALTGESVPISKILNPILEQEVTLADRKNMVFMGTSVAGGKGHFIVTETGIQTEFGKIASLLQERKEEKTPLQVRLEQLGHRLVWICLAVVALVFVVSLLRKTPWIDAILTSLSLAVAAIPEGLPAVVTIALAAGVWKMAKRNALIRRLPSVETLGCASVICTDKTGTLTRNEMEVKSIWVGGKSIEVTGNGYIPEGKFLHGQNEMHPQEDKDLMTALEICLLCNNAGLVEQEGKWQIVGDPTEGALLVVARKAGLKKASLETLHPIIEEIPFDSERKRMSVLRKDGEQLRLYVKGALDILIESSQCSEDQRLEISRVNREMASQALRVLAVAYKDIKQGETVSEENLVFVGLIAMRDPPRAEAKIAIEKCKKAGIQPVMITGDHHDTAVAIAKELGLLSANKKTMTGIELDHLSEEAFNPIVKDIAVYSRVTAAHKLKIVRAWKNYDEVVAMTGDGVNDAPAIKEAHIGIAMGISGTDVTKEVSDLVILDDNFASIVNAVEEGRGIYNNIIKFVLFLLASNIAEIFVVFWGMALGFQDPEGLPFVSLLPVQLLWINLVTDGFPAVALSIDPMDPKVMERKPRKPSSPILSRGMIFHLLIVSSLIGIGTLIACHFGLRKSAELGHTMAFMTIVLLELVQAQVIRSQYGVRFFSNKWFFIALFVSLVCQLAVTYIPSFQKVFRTVNLGATEWTVILIITGVVGFFSYLTSKIYKRIAHE